MAALRAADGGGGMCRPSHAMRTSAHRRRRRRPAAGGGSVIGRGLARRRRFRRRRGGGGTAAAAVAAAALAGAAAGRFDGGVGGFGGGGGGGMVQPRRPRRLRRRKRGRPQAVGGGLGAGGDIFVQQGALADDRWRLALRRNRRIGAWNNGWQRAVSALRLRHLPAGRRDRSPSRPRQGRPTTVSDVIADMTGSHDASGQTGAGCDRDERRGDTRARPRSTNLHGRDRPSIPGRSRSQAAGRQGPARSAFGGAVHEAPGSRPTPARFRLANATVELRRRRWLDTDGHFGRPSTQARRLSGGSSHRHVRLDRAIWSDRLGNSAPAFVIACDGRGFTLVTGANAGQHARHADARQ